ncbi:MAG: sugar phosphate isomerase/epimerase [Planctomycetaceae bacterium]
MELSVSCRIAEGFFSKEEACLSFPELADLAVAAGYDSICMRASQIGVKSTVKQVWDARRILDDRGLGVSMISGDFDIVYNNDQGPQCLRRIGPYLHLAEALGAPMVRVCIKGPQDMVYAQAAAEAAASLGLMLVHQCHVQSLFETLDGIVQRLQEIDHAGFGLIFEAANLEQCGQDYGRAAIQRLAPWIRNVYVQNQRMNPSGAITLNTWSRGPVSFDLCEIHDSGGIRFAEIFEGLKSIGYDGPITVHQSAPQDAGLKPLTAATQTAQFLKALWTSKPNPEAK